MITFNHILQILLLVSTALALTIGFSTFNRKRVAGSREFAILMFAIAWWGACDVIQFLFESERLKAWISQISYVGIVVSPVAWVTFIFSYSHIQLRIPKWIRYFVPGFCGLFLLVVLTNDLHHLVYRRWELLPGAFGLKFYYGPLFWFWVAVSYVCLLAGTIRLILTALRSVTLFRFNIVLVILGALFPWMGNILYITGLNPITGFDPTPVAFTITGAIGLIIIFRQRLFDYVPLAYQNLFVNLNDAALVLDYTGEIVESNFKARELSGHSELKHLHYREWCRLLKDSPEEALLDYTQFEGNDGPELEIQLKKGREASRWILLKGRRIGQEGDDKRGFLLSFRDITLWKQNQMALEKSATLLGLCGRFADEMLRTPSWKKVYREYGPNFRSVSRASGCFVSCTPENESYFPGMLDREQRIWQKSWERELEENRFELSEIAEYVEFGNDIFVVLPLEVMGEKIADWIFFWSGVRKDEALEAMDVLKLASGILSSAIENEQHQEDLVKAKELAEQANRAKSEFLSVMSHEIRTPLNAVIGISHLMKDENQDPQLLPKINTLHNSAENLLGLVNDILDYSKIEAGKVELIEQEFAPNILVRSLIDPQEYKAKENRNQITFVTDLTDNSYYIGDRLRLGQVLTNLITNANKFTQNGTVEVKLEKVEGVGDEDRLRFSVSDTGIGINPEFIPKLFEMFSQATTSSTRKFGGTGLGLAISQRLLQLMGGGINVESEPEKGSRFWFEISLKRIDHMEEEQEGMTPENSEQALKDMKVLIVEDNVVNVFVCQNFLKKWKVSNEVAVNGAEGVEMVKQGAFDCVLMDIQMPVMDGYQATTEIRKFNPAIPIIALTASAMLDHIEKRKMAGMNDYLTKPFRPDELFSVLLKHKKQDNRN